MTEPAGTPALVRVVRAAALALGTGALLAACSFGSVGRSGDAETEERGIELAADLQADFEQLPGATAASVSYQDNITTQAALRANVQVTPDTDVTATLDAEEQAIWSSEIDPLRSLYINVTAQVQPLIAEDRDYDLDDRSQVDALVERWGERP